MLEWSSFGILPSLFVLFQCLCITLKKEKENSQFTWLQNKTFIIGLLPRLIHYTPHTEYKTDS